MLKHCNSKRWHSATAEALSSGPALQMPGKSQRNTHCGKTQRLRRTRASQRPSGSSDLLSSQQQRTGSAVRMQR